MSGPHTEDPAAPPRLVGEQGPELVDPRRLAQIARTGVPVGPGQTGVLFADEVEPDDQFGCGYIRLTHLMGAAVAGTVDLGHGLHLDVDGQGSAIGIEYLNGRENALVALVGLLTGYCGACGRGGK